MLGGLGYTYLRCYKGSYNSWEATLSIGMRVFVAHFRLTKIVVVSFKGYNANIVVVVLWIVF